MEKIFELWEFRISRIKKNVMEIVITLERLNKLSPNDDISKIRKIIDWLSFTLVLNLVESREKSLSELQRLSESAIKFVKYIELNPFLVFDDKFQKIMHYVVKVYEMLIENNEPYNFEIFVEKLKKPSYMMECFSEDNNRI
jgi:hypothetical protein